MDPIEPHTPPAAADPGAGRAAAALALTQPRILVPLDFSEASEAALHYAIALARELHGHLVLLHAIEPLPYPFDLPYLAQESAPPVQPARRHLLAVATRSVPAELMEETSVEVGIPFQVICDAARTLDCDLIVLATHGYGGLKHVLLGSTAERVVRHAHCPVLTVRTPPAGGRPESPDT